MLELTLPQFEMLEQKLKDIPEKIPIATARAINRSAEAARTQASRSARESYNVKQKDIASTIKIKKAYPSDLSADIRSVGSVLELMKFKVRPGKPQPNRKRPVVVSVKKGSSKPIDGAFVAQVSNGHVNVFTRVSKKRLPIQGHYGPSVPQMLGSDNVSQAVGDKALEVLDTRLEHEINRVLGGN